MKITRVLLVAAAALLLQMVFARVAVGGRWVFDVVLVGVVYAALRWGPASGMWVGTLAGLAQDALSGDVVGLGGFAKTVVGFGTGVAGTQFLVARPFARAGVVAVATIPHRVIIVGLLAVVDQDWKGLPWGALAMETGLNAIIGLVAFQATEMLPGAVRQSRARRRPSLSRRQW